MNSVTVEELVMRIEIELDKFRSQAGQAEGIDKRLRKSLKDTEKASKDTGAGFKDLGGNISEVNKELTKKIANVTALTRRVVGFFAVLTGSTAIQRFASGIADANDQLGFLSQRLGMAARDVKSLDTAVSALGGKNAQVINTLKGLNQGIQEMVIMGNDSLIPFFGALGVGVTDAAGNMRAMDDILLDMSDSFSRMDAQRAYAIASAMGLDEGVANALIQGREAMQDMLGMTKTLYVSTQAELNASRELIKAQSFLSQQWDGLKTMLANALIPHLTKLTKTVSGWLEYLHRNERTVKNFFEGLAIALGVVLIPLLAKATLALLGFISPILGATLAVAALALGFAALYDDYKTWANGGKSLFDWTVFAKWIDDANFSVDGLAKGFAYLITGYESWAQAWDSLFDWAKSKNIIDENGLSIRGLGNAIKDMVKDAVASMPLLQAMIETIALMLDGDWKGAASRAMDIPKLAIQGAYDITGGVAERLGGFVDTTFGIDPNEEGSIAGVARRMHNWGARTLRNMFGGGSDIEAKLEQAEIDAGLPAGVLKSVWHQETGGNQAYIDDPAKYHFELNSEGRRVAEHTGEISTAFGPFGILESTAKDPGFGVAPLADKGIDEQIRFFSEYLAARIKYAGSLKGGLAGYGEGAPYANSVIGRMRADTSFGGGVSVADAHRVSSSVGSSGGSSVEVNVGSVTVQTSAPTLPAATSDAVAAGVAQAQGSGLLEQLGGGLR